MPDKLSCPYCSSTSIRLLDAMFTVRLVERPEGGGFVERKCPIYRCNACGRQFSEMEAEECPVLEEDVDNDIKKMDLIRRQVHLRDITETCV